MKLNQDKTRDGSQIHGFTLVELMISTALTSLLSAYFFLAVITAQRLYEATIADVELSMQAQFLREKLLFNVVDGEGGVMNASRDCMEYSTPTNPKKKSDTVKYRMYSSGPKTTVSVKNKKMHADRGNASKLAMPSARFVSDQVFALSEAGNQLSVTLDLMIEQGPRRYQLKQEVVSPFLNN
jgi:prepilin-type N-terminal cleavage/methylation domain-containing protein